VSGVLLLLAELVLNFELYIYHGREELFALCQVAINIECLRGFLRNKMTKLLLFAIILAYICLRQWTVNNDNNWSLYAISVAHCGYYFYYVMVKYRRKKRSSTASCSQ